MVTTLVVTAVTVLDWPVTSLRPSLRTFDGGWHYVLHLWAQHLSSFSARLDFPYGPLGFLSVPEMWWTWSALLAWVYTAAVTVSAATVAYLALRRSHPWWVAGGLALAVVRTLMLLNASVEAVPLIAATAVLAWRPDSRRRRLASLAGLGVLTAMTTLVKFSDGVALVGLLVLVPLLWEREILRGLAAAGGTFLAALVALWAALTQGLGALPHFLRGSWELSQGYWSLTLDKPVGWDLAAALAIGILVVALLATGRGSGLHRVAAGALGVWILWLGVKHGYVRNDHHHVPGMFATEAMLLCAALPRAPAVEAGRLTLTAVSVVVAGVTAGPLAVDFTSALGPERHLGEQVQAWFDGGLRDKLPGSAQRVLARRYDLPAPMLDAIGSSTVQIDPYEVQAAWTYRLHLLPIPVVQTVQGYTPWLDQDDADAVSRDSEAASFVLRDLTIRSIGRRFPAFESPQMQIAELCHYREVAADGRWQLLQRTGNRCGQPRRLSTVPVGSAAVTVPDAGPGNLLVATFHVPRSLTMSLLRTVWRDRPPVLVVNGQRFHFVSDNATQPRLLVAPAGAPAGPAGTTPANVRTLGFPRLRGVTVTFLAIPYR